MKRWIEALPEALLAAAAAGLLAMTVLPSRRAAVGPSAPRGASEAVPAPAAASAPSAPADPDAVVALFYGAPAVIQAPPQSVGEAKPEEAPVKPVEAPWLSYVGYFSGMDGKPFHYVKDSRSGRLIKVARDLASDWILVEDAADRIVVRHGGDVYAVARKR